MVYFLLGILFVSFFQPILDGLAAVILSSFELIKSYIAVKITKNGKNIDSGGSGFAIGFHVPDDDIEEEDDGE